MGTLNNRQVLVSYFVLFALAVFAVYADEEIGSCCFSKNDETKFDNFELTEDIKSLDDIVLDEDTKLGKDDWMKSDGIVRSDRDEKYNEVNPETWSEDYDYDNTNYPTLKQAAYTNLQYSVECGVQNSVYPFNKILYDDDDEHRDDEDDDGRIVGGVNAATGEFPWQVSLQRRSAHGGHHMCGGSILSERIILTAAHCVHDFRPVHLQILAGADSLSSRSRYWQARNVKKIITVGYNQRNISRDIAVLVLDRPLRFDSKHVAPVCLPSTNYVYSGKHGIVTGWGTLSERGKLAPTLQVVSIPFVSREQCRKDYDRDGDGAMVTECNLCTGSKKGGLDSCQGDSGGPMTCVEDDGRHYLCGIVSWGTGCGHPNHPGVYTFTPCYANWIARKVAEYSEK